VKDFSSIAAPINELTKKMYHSNGVKLNRRHLKS